MGGRLTAALGGGENVQLVAVFGDGAAGNGDAFGCEQVLQPGIGKRVARVFGFNQLAQAGLNGLR